MLFSDCSSDVCSSDLRSSSSMSFTVLSGECLFDRHIIGSDRFGYDLERPLTVPNVQTLRKMPVALQSFLPAEVGASQRVRQGAVVQRIGRSEERRVGTGCVGPCR